MEKRIHALMMYVHRVAHNTSFFMFSYVNKKMYETKFVEIMILRMNIRKTNLIFFIKDEFYTIWMPIV